MVVLDILMPQKDGFETLKELRTFSLRLCQQTSVHEDSSIFENPTPRYEYSTGELFVRPCKIWQESQQMSTIGITVQRISGPI